MTGGWPVNKGVNDLRPFPRCGRFVAVAVPLALTALTAAWLFLGATPERTAVLWCSLILLAASLAIWLVAVLRDGDRSRSETYQWAVRTASVFPRSGEHAVPRRLNGTRWLTARYGGTVVTVFTLVALWVTLAAADAQGTGTSAVRAQEGAVIERRPIVRIENQDVGSGPRSSATADYTVLLPSSAGEGGVPVTFRAYTNRRRGIGSELFVASVPERPELGAIGDDRLAEVERQLAGRAVEFDAMLVIGPIWGLATLAALIGWWLTESIRRRCAWLAALAPAPEARPRRARRVGGRRRLAIAWRGSGPGGRADHGGRAH
ncbi:hypothetical protein [Streptomyces sp. NPDC102476]|uniref:hypothetical protein n=1 Tax=Streptomyces sp. NPDC102476 TaxID=3366181 RepID=UPI0038228225